MADDVFGALQGSGIGSATAGADFFTPYILLTDINIWPKTASLEAGEILQINATKTPSDANEPVNWESTNTSVATVSSNGTVTAISDGSATITATGDESGIYDTATINVEDRAVVEFTALRILDKDFEEIGTIGNTKVRNLVIRKELGGSQSLSFSLPYRDREGPLAATSEIRSGRYIECEGQRYFPERLVKTRGADGNPFLSVTATHIFFEIEHLQANHDVGEYNNILNFLTKLLTQYGITVSGINADHPLYHTIRYVEYGKGNTVMDCLKTIFKPYFASFKVDNLQLLVIPDPGEIGTLGVEFKYAENNHAISKECDYSDIITKLYAEGDDDLEYIADAPSQIKNLYRQERERRISFSGVSYLPDLQYLADRYLDHKMRPLTTYRLSVAELNHISNIEELYPGRKFKINLGERVVVTDEEFGIDVESVVQQYSYRPLEHSELSDVVIGDLKPYDITFMEPETDEGVPGSGGSGDKPPRVCRSLHGIISTEEPSPGNYEENCLWFKY